MSSCWIEVACIAVTSSGLAHFTARATLLFGAAAAPTQTASAHMPTIQIDRIAITTSALARMNEPSIAAARSANSTRSHAATMKRALDSSN